MSSLATGIVLFLGFHALGAGVALRLRAWLDLPARALPVLVAVATAALSYGIFWIAFFAPRMRSISVVAVVAVSGAIALTALRDPRTRAAVRAPAAWLPPLLTGALAIGWLWPLLAGGPIVNNRLTWILPPDNILPGLFAHQVETSPGWTRPTPLLGPESDRASERPPLQAAVAVTIGALVRGGSDEYQILATLCQLQWLPALLLLGGTAGLSRRAMVIVVAACALSGFFFVNTLYAWPKLFAAALMLGGLAILLEAPSAAPGAARGRILVAAAAGALSLLAHPGPAFTLLAVPFCWPMLRRIVHVPGGWRAAAAAALVVIALIAPWLAFQTLIDPPTGRLLREHLGDGRLDGTPAQTIVRANLQRPLAEQIRVRFGNLASQVGDPMVSVWPVPIAYGQHEQFFHHGAALGVLLIGLVAALWPSRGGTADDVVRRLAILAMVALALWSVLVFGAGDAVVHHGSPVTTVLLFVAGAYGLARLPAPMGWTLLALHAAAAARLWFLPFWRGPWAG